MKIAGLAPTEYAALWGRTTDADGVLFYNVSSAHQVKDRTFWAAFISAIRRQREDVMRNAQEYRTPQQDAKNLLALLLWAEDQYTAA